jgi:NAD(P)H-flavin reductase
MFSIGSGIAALYPIAKTIVDNETELTRVHLIAGFQSLIQVPLKKELRQLVDYWNFKCTLQLSQLNGMLWNTMQCNICNIVKNCNYKIFFKVYTSYICHLLQT